MLSGTLKKGDTLKILGENYNLEDEEDMVIKPVKALYIFQSRFKLEINEAPAGSWIMIEGID